MNELFDCKAIITKAQAIQYVRDNKLHIHSTITNKLSTPLQCGNGEWLLVGDIHPVGE